MTTPYDMMVRYMKGTVTEQELWETNAPESWREDLPNIKSIARNPFNARMMGEEFGVDPDMIRARANDFARYVETRLGGDS